MLKPRFHFFLCRVCGITIVALFSCAMPSEAKNPPADLCSLLTTDEVEHVLGQPFNQPKETSAAPGTGKEVSGKNCAYQSKKSDGPRVTFIIYVDPSASVAKESFSRFQMMFGVKTTLSGVGDSAYIDSIHAIHVLKDRVRYFIQVVPVSNNSQTADKQVAELASSVASQL